MAASLSDSSFAHANRHLLNLVGRIAESIPLGLLGLDATGQICCPSADSDQPALLDAGKQLPPLPAVALPLADQASRLPHAAANAELDVRDRRRSGPGDAADGQRAACDPCARLGLRNQGADPLERYWLAHRPAALLALNDVPLRLEMASERPVDDLDLGQPLDRRYRIPAGNDQSQGIAVLHRQGFTVHGIGQQRPRIPRIGERQAAFEVDRAGFRLQRSRVGAPKQHLPRTRLDAGAFQDFHQRHACPLGRAYRSQLPLFTLNRRVQQRATVARALQCGDERLRAQAAHAAQAETQRPLDDSAHAEPPGLWIEPGNLKMIAYVEVRVRRHNPTDKRVNRRLTVERMRATDDEAGSDGTLAGLLRIKYGRRVASHRKPPLCSLLQTAGRGFARSSWSRPAVRRQSLT